MLYDFSELKSFVMEKMGIDSDSIDSHFKPITQKFSSGELRKHIDFSNMGIFFINSFGEKIKGFLYIESGYNLELIKSKNLKTSIPKFHVQKCKTIEQMIEKKDFNGKYVFSNRTVLMRDKIDNLEKEPTACGNCIKLNNKLYKGMTTTEFVNKVIMDEKIEGTLNKGDLPINIPVDQSGYTLDKEIISKKFREENNFTCQECSLQLNPPFDSYFLETHHIDGNKRNNSENNLKCLCILCHANYNEIHKKNYSSGDNKIKLDDFIFRFKDRLLEVGNKYLNL